MIWRVVESMKSLAYEPDPLHRYGGAALAVAATTGVMLTVRDHLGVLSALLVFLLLSLALALVAGSGPATLAAVLSFLAFNFFFIPPYHRLTIARTEHVLALFAYLAVAIVTGQLVAGIRTRTEVAEREQRRTALLYELNAALVAGVTLDSILTRIVERVVHVYGADRSRLLLLDGDQLTVRARFPSTVTDTIDRQDLAVVTWAIEHRAPAGRSSVGRRIHPPRGTVRTRPLPARRFGPDVLFLPIATADRTIGVLEVGGKRGGGRFSEDDERLLTSFANQAALSLERARLTEEAGHAAILAQSDELKSALLATVSHDLRTPLAAIKASVTSLLDSSVPWGEAARAEFLQAIDEETDRLTLIISNLLDLSRIEGGALRPAKEWYDVAELIADVAHRLRSRTLDRPLMTVVEPDLPIAHFDYVEIAQVLLNLGDNATKYGRPGTPIVMSARRVPTAIEVAVGDRGPGIPAYALPHLFEKFYRVAPAGRIGGTGIGLTICKGLVEAHGGRIWADSVEREGTTVRFTIPLTTPAECAEPAA